MFAFRKRAEKKCGPVKLGFHLTVSGVVIVLALLVLIYPAVTIVLLMLDSQLEQTGESRLVPWWFNSAAGRFLSWADGYLASNYAASLRQDNIPGTEWPMFGAVFFLVTAEDLHRQGCIDVSDDTIHEAIEKAAEIVVSPVTATWVREKWGDRYLEKENVFYRMLLIMGLSSYENITTDRRHHSTMAAQRTALADELAHGKCHLLNDYPSECYPADMLWAVAAIQRAARLDDEQHDALAESLMAAFDGALKTPEGLPAFQAEAATGRIIQNARGCGNSGIILFAGELNPDTTVRWYNAYEQNFWKNTGWIAGFTEMPLNARDRLMDVDSGPVFHDFGSVATAFGIGAAKTVGRFDHAAPMTLESVACSWPTPFGFLVPGLMGWLATDSWSLGEVALLFSMTRPTVVSETVPFGDTTPLIVWLMLAAYAMSGIFFIWYEIRACRRLLRQRANYSQH